MATSCAPETASGIVRAASPAASAFAHDSLPSRSPTSTWTPESFRLSA